VWFSAGVDGGRFVDRRNVAAIEDALGDELEEPQDWILL
jgi:hypothetical protein